MNKEDKEDKEDKVFSKMMFETMEMITKRLEQLANPPPSPVIFTSKCVRENCDTAHLSYIANNATQGYVPNVAATTGVGSYRIPKPIKRCLSCGLVTQETKNDTEGD